MPCYYPLDGWRAKRANENGKYPIVFDHKQAQLDQPVKLPCSKCTGCRLERSRQWAIRCVHESQLYDTNSFITLTYNDESLPYGHSLDKKHWQDFMKRLRKKLEPLKIRFFMCGEYGEEQDPTSPNLIGRPHFHAIIFNYDFPDKKHKATINENKLYESDLLTSVWGFGHCTVGDMTFETAAYVARYVMKKINGEPAEEHYQRVDVATGQMTPLTPEFNLCSRMPAIGKHWYDKYMSDCEKGFITIRGKKMPLPKYYKTLLDDSGSLQYQQQKLDSMPDPNDSEYQYDRLRVKEKIKLKRITTLTRTL